MLNDFQKGELSSRVLLVLEQNRAGRADERAALAAQIVEKTEEFLSKQFSTQPNRGGVAGVVQSNDIPD